MWGLKKIAWEGDIYIYIYKYIYGHFTTIPNRPSGPIRWRRKKDYNTLQKIRDNCQEVQDETRVKLHDNLSSAPLFRLHSYNFNNYSASHNDCSSTTESRAQEFINILMHFVCMACQVPSGMLSPSLSLPPFLHQGRLGILHTPKCCRFLNFPWTSVNINLWGVHCNHL